MRQKYKPYTGRQGDIILLDFMPNAGSEIGKRRPAVIVSNDDFNQHCTVRMVCPITSTVNQFPLHVVLDQGSVLCEQMKSLDVGRRNVQFLETIPQDLLDEIIDILLGSLEKV